MDWIIVWTGSLYGLDHCMDWIIVWTGSLYGLDHCMDWIIVWYLHGVNVWSVLPLPVRQIHCIYWYSNPYRDWITACTGSLGMDVSEQPGMNLGELNYLWT